MTIVDALFETEYANRPKLQPMVGEISWAKNLLIAARCKDGVIAMGQLKGSSHA